MLRLVEMYQQDFQCPAAQRRDRVFDVDISGDHYHDSFRIALLDRREPFDHPVPHKTVESEVCRPFHFRKLHTNLPVFHPPHFRPVDRQ